MRERLLNNLTGVPYVGMPAAPKQQAEDQEFAVERNAAGNVVITLGMTSPFELPPAMAIKLGCLLLKHGGADVKFD
jgi:hypothetical protein